MARFTTLYSGSSGNAGVVEHDGKFLLIDMGASCKATVLALDKVGLDPANMQAILVTHEHSDHIKGLKVFLKKYNIPVYAKAGTLNKLQSMQAVPETAQLHEIANDFTTIGDFDVFGFNTSHDAADSCGYSVATKSGATMALATDLGVMTSEVLAHLSYASFVALEANYERELLRMGAYPYHLKRRIESELGHLSNKDSAATVAALVAKGCRKLHMCHLSGENNYPGLVRQAIETAFSDAGMHMPEDCLIQIARRNEPSEWVHFDAE